MLVNNGTTEQNAYLDKCVKNAITQIANLDIDSISKLSHIAKQFYADSLAEISAFTKISYFAMDNFANLNAYTLASMIENEKKTLARISFGSENMLDTKSIIDAFTASLSQTQDQIIANYNLELNSLSLFNYDDIENGINFKQLENSSPILFKYFEGKQTLKCLTDLIKMFTDTKIVVEEDIKSLSITSIDKARDILLYFVTAINSLQDNVSNIEFIIDSCDLAKNTYNKLLLSNDKYLNSFLGRNYDIIKNDIISNYF